MEGVRPVASMSRNTAHTCGGRARYGAGAQVGRTVPPLVHRRGCDSTSRPLHSQLAEWCRCCGARVAAHRCPPSTAGWPLGPLTWSYCPAFMCTVITVLKVEAAGREGERHGGGGGWRGPWRGASPAEACHWPGPPATPNAVGSCPTAGPPHRWGAPRCRGPSCPGRQPEPPRSGPPAVPRGEGGRKVGAGVGG